VSPAVVGDWGWWRVTVGGTDVSAFRGAPVHATFQDLEPWGSGPGGLDVPAMTPLDTPGSGATSWLTAGSPVDVWRRNPDGSQTSLWSGEVSAWNPTLQPTQGRLPITLVGDMEAASLQNWQPPAGLDPTDIGHQIADALNAVLGRRYGNIGRVTTGILTTYRGSDDQSVLAYCQELLSTAVTDDGTSQWTVYRSAPRRYAIGLKDRSTVTVTVRAGQPGVELDLSRDHTQAPTRIFGSGVTTKGYSWRNMVYPSAYQNTGATYPYTDVSRTMSLGTTDADTDTGTGVSDLQERLNQLNLSGDVAVDGVLNSNDIAAIRVAQRHLGLAVDGVVAGQTWSGVFDIGDGSLGDAVRLPLAWITSSLPTITRPDGTDGGDNPDWVSSTLVVDKDIAFGGGVSKAQGRRAAEAILARDYPAGLTGRVVLRVDPQEMHRFAVPAGTNIKVEGVEGYSPVLHIAAVDVDTDGAVALTVDERGRDMINLVQIMQRTRDNAINPAGLPKSRFARRALLSSDTVTPFDGESPAGKIPNVPVFAGLWTCIWTPCSLAGRLAKIEITTSPATKYGLAFFGTGVQPDDLLHLVGNPLTQETPWTEHEDDLLDLGWIEGWGSSQDAPGLNAAGDVRATWRDNGTLEYRSERPPLIRVCFFSPIATRFNGRVYPAPLDA
jgi:peptidoglycan hydrolase-like protein with peptidoglycan-binding domain